VVSLRPRPGCLYAVLAIGFAFLAGENGERRKKKGKGKNPKPQIPIKLQLGKIPKIEEDEAEEQAAL
jgi:hypothetical protein